MIPTTTHYITGVPATKIALVWPRVEPLLRTAMPYGYGETLEAIQDRLLDGRVQLWVIEDFLGIVGTSIVIRTTERLLFGEFLAGTRYAEWIDDWRTVMEAFAKAHGCTAIEFRGRRGYKIFERSHPDYKPVFTIYRKELGDAG